MRSFKRNLCIIASVAGLLFTPALTHAEEAAAVVEKVEQVTALKERAEQMLIDIIDKATQAGAFALDQIPILIKELLVWNAAFHAVLVATALGIAGVGLAAYRAITRIYTEKGVYAPPYSVVGMRWFAVVPCVGVGFILFMCNFLSLLKIILAPRVWLIEYAADLVK